MLLRLILLLTIVPVIELIVLLQVHHAIAARWGMGTGLAVTLGAIVVTGIVGAWLARSQGLGVLRAIGEATARGQFPGRALIDAAMILVGGALLLTPGFLTDLLGFSLLLPWTRALHRALLARWLRAKIARGEAVLHARFVQGGFGASSGAPFGGDGPAPSDPTRARPEDIIIDVTPDGEESEPQGPDRPRP